MIQTGALLLDAYRDLNSRKLFWLTVILTAIAVGLMAVLGINEGGPSVLWMTISLPEFNSKLIPPETFYKLIFSYLGVGIWLTWIATILALVSTSSMIPDLVASGSIDMMLSKPISRMRLLLTRWAGGLIFAFIQATVFAVGSFLVIGIRGGAWEPALFLIVPVLVIFYSYLFCVCALIGLLTRSTIASIMLTLVFWVVIYGLQRGEALANTGHIHARLNVAAIEGAIDRVTKAQAAGDTEGDIPKLTQELEDAKDTLQTWSYWHWPFYGLVTCLPKTTATTDWLDRQLQVHAGLSETTPEEEDQDLRMFGRSRVKMRDFAAEVKKDAEERRGLWWSIGTSLCFEAVVLGLCVWTFRRRDF